VVRATGERVSVVRVGEFVDVHTDRGLGSVVADLLSLAIISRDDGRPSQRKSASEIEAAERSSAPV